MRILENLSEAKELIGQELGVSDWQRINLRQISRFGKVTGDEQWIHMAPIRAKLLSPFKMIVFFEFISNPKINLANVPEFPAFIMVLFLYLKPPSPFPSISQKS